MINSRSYFNFRLDTFIISFHNIHPHCILFPFLVQTVLSKGSFKVKPLTSWFQPTSSVPHTQVTHRHQNALLPRYFLKANMDTDSSLPIHWHALQKYLKTTGLVSLADFKGSLQRLGTEHNWLLSMYIIFFFSFFEIPPQYFKMRMRMAKCCSLDCLVLYSILPCAAISTMLGLGLRSSQGAVNVDK